MRARLLPAALFLALSAALVPVHALAHGPVLRGREIDAGVKITDSTGDCICLERWFTVGLRTGTVKLTGAIQQCDRVGPTCDIILYLYRGGTAVKRTQAACFTAQAHCKARLRLSYRVRHAGVYYIQIIGQGTLTIDYSLRVQGPIYALHCKKYC